MAEGRGYFSGGGVAKLVSAKEGLQAGAKELLPAQHRSTPNRARCMHNSVGKQDSRGPPIWPRLSSSRWQTRSTSGLLRHYGKPCTTSSWPSAGGQPRTGCRRRWPRHSSDRTARHPAGYASGHSVIPRPLWPGQKAHSIAGGSGRHLRSLPRWSEGKSGEQLVG